MNYVLAGFGTVILALVLYVGALQSENDELRANLQSSQLAYAIANVEIDRQNQTISLANKALANYSQKMSVIESDYNKTKANLITKIKEVKSCEDGMQYLTEMLESIRGL